MECECADVGSERLRLHRRERYSILQTQRALAKRMDILDWTRWATPRITKEPPGQGEDSDPADGAMVAVSALLVEPVARPYPGSTLLGVQLRRRRRRRRRKTRKRRRKRGKSGRRRVRRVHATVGSSSAKEGYEVCNAAEQAGARHDGGRRPRNAFQRSDGDIQSQRRGS